MTLSTFYLNGWQRVGIVLSALWAVGVLIFAWQIETTAASKHNDAFYHCLFAPQSDVDQSKCLRMHGGGICAAGFFVP